MKKIILIVFTAILTSFFFFPFEFTFLPGMNTKQMMASLGLVIFFLNFINRKGVVVSKEVFIASVIAGIFSLVCLFSITYNITYDYSYATYIVSMWVWLMAAYAACNIIKMVHGYISVKLVANYLIGVCAAQCALALMIDNIPYVKMLVDRYTAFGADKLDEIDRIYGIGAALDVAGTRFSAILAMIAVLLCRDDNIRANKKYIAMYVFLFFFIAVVGSIIARTTNIGIILSFIYIVYATGIWKIRIRRTNLRLWLIFISVTFLLMLVCAYLYNNVQEAHDLLRFGFEGFFNWIETGEWRSNSTDALQNMWVFPETQKTWMIGDGLLAHQVDTKKYYMETDVGYSRFIFYCGLIGLSVFSAFFIYLSTACYKMFPKEKDLFLLLFVLVFAIFAKVATDIFLVFAPFLCIPMVQRRTDNQVKRL